MVWSAATFTNVYTPSTSCPVTLDEPSTTTLTRRQFVFGVNVNDWLLPSGTGTSPLGLTVPYSLAVAAIV